MISWVWPKCSVEMGEWARSEIMDLYLEGSGELC